MEPGPETRGRRPPDSEKAELETGCSNDTGTDPALNGGPHQGAMFTDRRLNEKIFYV